MRRSPYAVLGIDPGGAHCGIVVRAGDDLLFAAVVSNEGDWVEHQRAIREKLSEAVRAVPRGFVLLTGVEDANPPGWHYKGKAKPIPPAQIMGLCRTLGAVTAWLDMVEVPWRLVPPGGHGEHRPLHLCYPAGIVGRGNGLGGPQDHARSAWDVSQQIRGGVRR